MLSRGKNARAENTCVLIDFIYEKWFGRVWAKKFV
jgi:hypothetical protein